MFSEGMTVIDTKKQEEAYIVKIIESSIKTLYILETNNNEYYITDEENIILYDKNYFKN